MWIFLNDSFLSIVADERSHSWLRVRARAAGDIERAFPDAKVEVRPANDYRYLALITRSEVAKVIADQVLNIRYGNFKASVEEQDRHDAYLGVWSTMHQFQRRRAGLAPSRLLADNPEQDYGFDDPELWGERAGNCLECGDPLPADQYCARCGSADLLQRDSQPAKRADSPKMIVRYRAPGRRKWCYVEKFVDASNDIGPAFVVGNRARADRFDSNTAHRVLQQIKRFHPTLSVQAVNE